MARPGPNLPDVSRVVCHYTTDAGTSAINVFHVLSSGAAALDVFNRFTTAWTADQLKVVTSRARLSSIDVTRLDNLAATESFTTVGTKFTGGSLTPEFSPAVCALIKYTTGFRGLASTGRTFVPFIAEESQENGAVATANRVAHETAWVQFVNSLTTQTIPLQVTSYGVFNPDNTYKTPPTTHTVTACKPDPILATQRKRQSRLR